MGVKAKDRCWVVGCKKAYMTVYAGDHLCEVHRNERLAKSIMNAPMMHKGSPLKSSGAQSLANLMKNRRTVFCVTGPDGLPKVAVTRQPEQYAMVETFEGDLLLRQGYLAAFLTDVKRIYGRLGEQIVNDLRDGLRAYNEVK